MYRALTLAIIQADIDISNEKQIKELALKSNIELKQIDSELKTFLNGKDVSHDIRLPEINQIISKFFRRYVKNI